VTLSTTDSQPSTLPKWLIWSSKPEHPGWWRPNAGGYSGDRAEAGLFSFEEATNIVSKSNEHHRGNHPRTTMCPEW
jgi:hypothetical protein